MTNRNKQRPPAQLKTKPDVDGEKEIGVSEEDNWECLDPSDDHNVKNNLISVSGGKTAPFLCCTLNAATGLDTTSQTSIDSLH